MFLFSLESKIKAFHSTILGHLVQKRKTRDSDVQFTRELFLHEAEVHMLLVVHEKPSSGYFTPSERPKNTIFAISHSIDFILIFEEFEN
jgi:hypothetical protein